MKFLIFTILTVASFLSYADPNDLTDEQKKEVLTILLMKQRMDNDLLRLTPEITITGQEGFKFKTQNPVVIEDASESWSKYKNTNIKKPDFLLTPLLGQNANLSRVKPSKSSYQFHYFNFGDEFIIKNFIHVGSDWMFILADKGGKTFLVDNEHDLARMLKGDQSNFSGRDALIYDWMTNGKRRQSVKNENIDAFGIARFVQGLRENQTYSFPIFKNRTIPSPEPKSNGEWINYFLKELVGKQATITNERIENHRYYYNIEADTDVLMLLVYAKFLSPYAAKFDYQDGYKRYTSLVDQDEADVIAGVLHSKRKWTKEQIEEMKKLQEDMERAKLESKD